MNVLIEEKSNDLQEMVCDLAAKVGVVEEDKLFLLIQKIENKVKELESSILESNYFLDNENFFDNLIVKTLQILNEEKIMINLELFEPIFEINNIFLRLFVNQNNMNLQHRKEEFFQIIQRIKQKSQEIKQKAQEQLNMRLQLLEGKTK